MVLKIKREGVKIEVRSEDLYIIHKGRSYRLCDLMEQGIDGSQKILKEEIEAVSDALVKSTGKLSDRLKVLESKSGEDDHK